jgi:hypothetical protein
VDAELSGFAFNVADLVEGAVVPQGAFAECDDFTNPLFCSGSLGFGGAVFGSGVWSCHGVAFLVAVFSDW